MLLVTFYMKNRIKYAKAVSSQPDLYDISYKLVRQTQRPLANRWKVAVHNEPMGAGTMTNQEEILEYGTLPQEDGVGSIKVLARGARVLEVTPAPTQPSALWVNPAVSALAESRWNVGGERTWISPELDFFLVDGEYRVPEQVDPGNYKLVRHGNTLKA